MGDLASAPSSHVAHVASARRSWGYGFAGPNRQPRARTTPARPAGHGQGPTEGAAALAEVILRLRRCRPQESALVSPTLLPVSPRGAQRRGLHRVASRP